MALNEFNIEGTYFDLSDDGITVKASYENADNDIQISFEAFDLLTRFVTSYRKEQRTRDT